MKKSILIGLLAVLLTGCTGKVEEVPTYFTFDTAPECEISITPAYVLQSNTITPELSELELLSADYAVPLETELEEGKANTDISANAAFLFNITDNEVLFAKNCYTSVYPASTTKLLTALMTLKYADLDKVITVSADNAGITKYGAQLCGFKKGDKVSVKTLLNALMVYSGNDAAVLLAEAISGDTEAFMELANQEASALGATHTHFVNPHGLHEEEHKTTAYDLYLIMRECMKYPEFLEIIGQSFYVVKYETASGEAAELPFEATNMYLNGMCETPVQIQVLGGKTGSTGAAGDCLILASSCNNKLYLSGVFGAKNKESLYTQMTALLTMELSEN